MMTVVAVSGSFDDLRARQVRFLHEASKLGHLHLLLWSDELVNATTGRPPTFPAEERLYFLQALRYVRNVTLVQSRLPSVLPKPAPDLWVVDSTEDRLETRQYCESRQIAYRVMPP
jgi:glycerol-3-phosphate cytidylyltransferase-like family protein